jgi:hypothetical protein
MSDSTPQLSHGQAIEYRAYARAFDTGSNAAVLYLLATCYYPVGQYQIFLEGSGDNNFNLMEIVPTVHNELTTYYVASWTSSYPLADPPTTVTITDASGSHTVPVEPWSLQATAIAGAAKAVATPG